MALSREGALRAARLRRRCFAQDQTAYADLRAAPSALTGGAAPATSSALSLPANARLGISFSAPVGAGQLSVDTETGRTLGTPALVADEIYRLDWLERTVDVTITSAIAGTATLYVFDQWMRSYPIATVVFT